MVQKSPPKGRLNTRIERRFFFEVVHNDVKATAACTVCGKPGAKQCGGCGTAAYCSQKGR